MALTINTNISSLIAQRNLASSTSTLNTSIERMTTGYKINHAKDNAAGYSIANMWVTQLGSLDVALDNASMGADLLTTAEETYSLLSSHLQRIRDLTEQAANGTYGQDSLEAIQSEIYARLQEITRIAANAEFNGIKILSYKTTGNTSGIASTGIDLQVGLYANSNSQINLEANLFKDASVQGLFEGMTTKAADSAKTLLEILKKGNSAVTALTQVGADAGLIAFSHACANLMYAAAGNTVQTDSDYSAKQMLAYIDKAIDDISGRVTKIGAAQNRVSSAISALDVQSQNLTSSLSTLRDANVAEESSNYIQSQILQQASATLLATANQLPSIALSLL